MKRVERLERQNRKLQGLCVLAVILVPALVLVSQCRPMAAGRILATDILVNDSKGHRRAELAMETDKVWGDRPVLRFWNSSGQLSSELAEGSLTLGNEGETPTLRLGYNRLDLFPKSQDKNALPTLSIETDFESGSRPFLQLFSGQTQGPPYLSLSVENGEPAIALSDAAGFATTIGSTNLVTTRTGEEHKTSAASVVLFGKDSKVLWSAP